MIVLKISTSKTTTKQSFQETTTWKNFQSKLSEITGMGICELEVLQGFPPTLLKSSQGDATIESLGVKTGSAITVRSNPQLKELYHTLCEEMGFSPQVVIQVVTELEAHELSLAVDLCQQISQQTEFNTPVVSIVKNVVRKVIPADNSCLFNAIGLLMKSVGSQPLPPIRYREMVVDAIKQDPITYCTEFLGKTPIEYTQWILNPNMWGGEIEISILSTRLQVEIGVADIRSSSLLIYGQGNGFARRIYLLYDGIHYDALVEETKSGSKVVEEVTAFDPANDVVHDQVFQVTKELKSQKKFVDLAAGEILCNVCGKVFVGEKQAVEHAKLTGHQNFAQSS